MYSYGFGKGEKNFFSEKIHSARRSVFENQENQSIVRTLQTGRDGITGENLLHQKKKRNFWLLLGAFLFAFHGVLHPLFHAEPHPDERTTETAAYRNDFSKRCAPAISLHCPVCSGIFQAAELPELLLLPEVSRSVLQYPEYPGLPFSRRSTGFRARAPPCLA